MSFSTLEKGDGLGVVVETPRRRAKLRFVSLKNSQAGGDADGALSLQTKSGRPEFRKRTKSNRKFIDTPAMGARERDFSISHKHSPSPEIINPETSNIYQLISRVEIWPLYFDASSIASAALQLLILVAST